MAGLGISSKIDNRAYIQYSQDPNWDYSKGLPNGTEEGFYWEESFVPVSHTFQGITVGPHKYRREKIGAYGTWTLPQKIIGDSVLGIETIFDSEDTDFVYYKAVTSLDDGSTYESPTLIEIPKGKDGEDGLNGSTDGPSKWFDTIAALQANTTYSNDELFGVFSEQKVYIYNSSAVSGIKPNDNTGSGRYVFSYSFAGTFASTSDMQQNPLVQAAKAMTPYLLQIWQTYRGIQDGAEPNPDTLAGYSVTELDDVSSAGSGQIITALERDKLNGIEDGAQVNEASDWDAITGTTRILNKPTLVWVAVGATEKYTTVKEAFDAGYRNIYLTGTVDETVSFSIGDETLRVIGAGASGSSIVFWNFESEVSITIGSGVLFVESVYWDIDQVAPAIVTTNRGEFHFSRGNAYCDGNPFISSSMSNFKIYLHSTPSFTIDFDTSSPSTYKYRLYLYDSYLTTTEDGFEIQRMVGSTLNLEKPNASLTMLETIEGSYIFNGANGVFNSTWGNPELSNSAIDATLTINRPVIAVNSGFGDVTFSSSVLSQITGCYLNSVTLNSNNNIISGNEILSSLTIGAVTGNIISNNKVGSDIIPVRGNILSNNSRI